MDCHDPGPFLAAVLECMESQVAQAGSLGVAIDSDHPALLPRLVKGEIDVTGYIGGRVSCLERIKVLVFRGCSEIIPDGVVF